MTALPRPQDILFGLLGLLVAALLAHHFGVIVLALVGAFVCGAISVLAAMVPSRHAPFWQRVFTSGFLAMVLSSLVLILPGTMGAEARGPRVARLVLDIAGLLPVMAVCFEVLRTPQVIRGILRWFGYRP